MPRPFANLLLASGLLAASPALAPAALAHVALVEASPAAQSEASDVRQLSLGFSGPLVDRLSGLDLAMTGMPGMAHHAPMKVTGFQTTLANESKTLLATLPRALPAGTYHVAWHVVGADTHRVEGGFDFTVK
ncbi:copper homeostasis periplasmic binding protein CopC [Novosphingobium pituita]|uniref:Copper resistance system metallochaperone PcoC n=1 Tax=Novosphingobium pituita TaxID=3056842 RepID=A0ABQ6P4P0_9SPHN|nr:copper homeostasis periplasmic binding protein CopC [Novosphingobium sp. IK01]GMM60223.1 copper resistance system metallochaperone PcoC [Novosphingobium sp. IK01]